MPNDDHLKRLWIYCSLAMLFGYAALAVPVHWWFGEIALIPLLIGAGVVLLGVCGLFIGIFSWNGDGK